ncbi:hypothetical protein DRO58_02130 [Candidatus Bathyarchaeota archaeon]|nr:MAG: hypothetical protein DRO58_09505 [Candidatus Bathyarchaeota archaeon]RLI28445.1 MAG: hypothetical protein DRO58_02130 [Candidatus Bathyarchaeota archaeon]
MVKTITVRDDVYKKLSAVKRPGESFSDLLERLVDSINPVEILIRLRGCVEFSDKDKLFREIEALRAEKRL